MPRRHERGRVVAIGAKFRRKPSGRALPSLYDPLGSNPSTEEADTIGAGVEVCRIGTPMPT